MGVPNCIYDVNENELRRNWCGHSSVLEFSISPKIGLSQPNIYNQAIFKDNSKTHWTILIQLRENDHILLNHLVKPERDDYTWYGYFNIALWCWNDNILQFYTFRIFSYINQFKSWRYLIRDSWRRIYHVGSDLIWYR